MQHYFTLYWTHCSTRVRVLSPYRTISIISSISLNTSLVSRRCKSVQIISYTTSQLVHTSRGFPDRRHAPQSGANRRSHATKGDGPGIQQGFGAASQIRKRASSPTSFDNCYEYLTKLMVSNRFGIQIITTKTQRIFGK